jgi:hypothetical protein
MPKFLMAFCHEVVRTATGKAAGRLQMHHWAIKTGKNKKKIIFRYSFVILYFSILFR